MKVIKAKIAESKDEFIELINQGEVVIIVQNQLYEDLKERMQKIQKGKIAKKGGVVATLAGMFVIPGGIAWIALAGGLASYFMGKNVDGLQDYRVEVNEIKEEIVLYKCKGKEKYYKGDIIER